MKKKSEIGQNDCIHKAAQDHHHEELMARERIRASRMRTAARSLVIIRISCFAIAVVCLAAGMYHLVDTVVFLSNSADTTGIVSGYRESRARYRDEYEPIVEYRIVSDNLYSSNDSRGSEKRVLERIGYSPKKPYEVGSRLDVIYDRHNPGNARLKDFWNLWRAVIGGFASGAFLLALGACLKRIVSAS
ncbi:MAG TPA: DUF3592 domain-containing protein [Spirochaetota bacterium]|nr:DUF3592 domain-containing protein [Spirochaetota bacterium]HOS39364.1 DUF3592 domain-containing protein [Spirochaetota bacterium]HPI21729.1 DUF3592 domain-containing protein [Spirochaetota bacterium]HPU89653.1 DUF3592 domain-containing protein [Spirochaetota bacterium]